MLILTIRHYQSDQNITKNKTILNQNMPKGKFYQHKKMDHVRATSIPEM